MNAQGTNRGQCIAAGGRLARFAETLKTSSNVYECRYLQVCCHYAYRFGGVYGGGYYGGSKPLYNPVNSVVGDPWIWGSSTLQVRVHFHFAINLMRQTAFAKNYSKVYCTLLALASKKMMYERMFERAYLLSQFDNAYKCVQDA